ALVRSTILPRISAVGEISFARVNFPREKRMVDLAKARDTPIASSTWEATTLPTIQAEPLEAQTPSRSSAIKSVSESSLGMLRFSVLASTCCQSPLRIAEGTRAEISLHN